MLRFYYHKYGKTTEIISLLLDDRSFYALEGMLVQLTDGSSLVYTFIA